MFFVGMECNSCSFPLLSIHFHLFPMFKYKCPFFSLSQLPLTLSHSLLFFSISSHSFHTLILIILSFFHFIQLLLTLFYFFPLLPTPFHSFPPLVTQFYSFPLLHLINHSPFHALKRSLRDIVRKQSTQAQEGGELYYKIFAVFWRTGLRLVCKGCF